MTDGAAAGRPGTHHYLRRSLAGIGTALATAFVAVPSLQAGAATSLTTITQGSAGTTPTVGSPVPAAAAKIAVTASAVNPKDGDVAEIAGHQVFLVVNAANEPATDYGIGTSGTLVKGDVYVVAGDGSFGFPTFRYATRATTTVIAAPQQVAFDANGNLVFGGKTASNNASVVLLVPRTSSSSTYGFTSTTAGALYGLASSKEGKVLPPPGISLPTDFTITSIAAGTGLEFGSPAVQDVAIGTYTSKTTVAAVYLFNYGAAQTLYGVSVGADSVATIAGGQTYTTTLPSSSITTCKPGAQSAPTTGATGFVVTNQTSLYADPTTHDLYVANGSGVTGVAGCTWVLPATTGGGTATKVAGDGVYPSATAPALGTTPATTTSLTAVSGITEDAAGNLVVSLSRSKGTATNGVYVIAGSAGHYYTQTTATGNVYLVAGGTTGRLGTFTAPVLGGADSSGNLWITDPTAHKLYELTGAPTGPAPAVSGISPTAGPTRGGTSVTITGTGFVAGATVEFGPHAATGVVVNGSTSITAVSPTGVAGTVNVTVTTPNGTSATTAADEFTYDAVPAVTAVSPRLGPTSGGTRVTITGSGFAAGAKVEFGSHAATGVVVNSSTSITAVSPANNVSLRHVTVTTPGGTSTTSLRDLFLYV